MPSVSSPPWRPSVVDRLRRFLAAAAARRRAPGQGARPPRRHHRRCRGRAHRPRQPGRGPRELDAFVDDWATRLAAGPPIALAMTKRLLDNSAEVSLEQAAFLQKR